MNSRFVDENTRLGWQEVLYNSVIFSIITNKHGHIDGSNDTDGQNVSDINPSKEDTSWYIDSVITHRKYAIHSGIIYSSSRFNHHHLMEQQQQQLSKSTPTSTFVSNLINRLSLSPIDKEISTNNTPKHDDTAVAANHHAVKMKSTPTSSKSSKSGAFASINSSRIIATQKVSDDDDDDDDDELEDKTKIITIKPSIANSLKVGGSHDYTTTAESSDLMHSTTTYNNSHYGLNNTRTNTTIHTPTPKTTIMPKAKKMNLTEVLRKQQSRLQF